MDDAERREKQRSYTQGYFAYQAKVIADRKQNPRDDLVSLLVTGDVDGERLDDEELLQESLLILIGGDETTRHVMTGGLELLIKHPDQKRKLIEDPSKIAVAVEEMLRLVSPILNMNRTLTRDTTLHGEKLREGDRVLLLYQAGNRDDRIFADPDRFDVAREGPHSFSFGWGAHRCLGAAFARAEIQEALPAFFACLSKVELLVDEPRWVPFANLRRLEALPIAFEPGPGLR